MTLKHVQRLNSSNTDRVGSINWLEYPELATHSPIRVLSVAKMKVEGAMAIDYTWLENTVIKRKLGEGERAALERILLEKSFAKNENILTQGKAGGVLYILRSGQAEISADINGQKMLLATAKEGALFGEITFLTGDTATANVDVLDDCLVYKLKREDCSQLMQSEPELVYALMAYMLVHAARIIRSKDADHASMMQYIGSSHK